MDPQQNPYLPPQAPAAGPAPQQYWADEPIGPTPAAFGIRFLARVLDNVAGLVLAMITGAMVGFAITIAGIGHVDQKANIALAFVITTVGSTAYQSIAEGMGTASIGKLICGLRVVHQDGYGRPSFGGAVVRNLGYFIDAMFFGVVAAQVMGGNAMKQRLGDKWGKTVVVHTATLANRASLPSPVMAILLAVFVRMFFTALSLAVKIV